MLTVAKEVGYKVIKGAGHRHPAYHYQLLPGVALRIDAYGKHEEVVVTDKIAKSAEYTFSLQSLGGSLLAVFKVGADEWCQPIAEVAVKRAKPKREKAVKAPGVAPVIAPAAEPEKPKEAKPAPAPKRAKGLRKKGYGLDL